VRPRAKVRPTIHGRIRTGPADPAAVGPIIWQTRIAMFTLHQLSWTCDEPRSFYFTAYFTLGYGLVSLGRVRTSWPIMGTNQVRDGYGLRSAGYRYPQCC